MRRTDAPHLYRNDAGHFTDVTAVSGISETELLWGDSWADVNNDGYLDLLYFVRPEQGLLMLQQRATGPSSRTARSARCT